MSFSGEGNSYMSFKLIFRVCTRHACSLTSGDHHLQGGIFLSHHIASFIDMLAFCHIVIPTILVSCLALMTVCAKTWKHCLKKMLCSLCSLILNILYKTKCWASVRCGFSNHHMPWISGSLLTHMEETCSRSLPSPFHCFSCSTNFGFGWWLAEL